MRSIVFALLILLVGQAVADSPSNPKTVQAITHGSNTHPILFEVFENGVSVNQYIAFSFYAYERGEIQHVGYNMTMFSPSTFDKHLELNMFNGSIVDGLSITNLNISPKAISFDMYMQPDHPLRFVATRKGASPFYQASVVGLWNGSLDKAKLIKTEWRQVSSITLPSSKIDY